MQGRRKREKKQKAAGRDWYEWVQALVCSVLAVVLSRIVAMSFCGPRS